MLASFGCLAQFSHFCPASHALNPTPPGAANRPHERPSLAAGPQPPCALSRWRRSWALFTSLWSTTESSSSGAESMLFITSVTAAKCAALSRPRQRRQRHSGRGAGGGTHTSPAWKQHSSRQADRNRHGVDQRRTQIARHPLAYFCESGVQSAWDPPGATQGCVVPPRCVEEKTTLLNIPGQGHTIGGVVFVVARNPLTASMSRCIHLINI